MTMKKTNMAAPRPLAEILRYEFVIESRLVASLCERNGFASLGRIGLGQFDDLLNSAFSIFTSHFLLRTLGVFL